MKREPSIHITYSKFMEIGKRIGIKEDDLKELFRTSAPFSINSRTVTVSTKMIEKKVKGMLEASRSDTDLFSQLIYYRRKSRKHRGISMMKPGHRDWKTLKEITAYALDFCMEFELDRRKGFIEFIDIGLNKMNKFGINKFLGMYESICETYEAMQEIQADDNPEATKAMYLYYTREIAEKTGIFEKYEERPEQYVWFVRARKQSDELKINPNIYIKAQFAGLDFAKGIPRPVQLVGAKATERISRYAYERGIIADSGGSSRSKLIEIFKEKK